MEKKKNGVSIFLFEIKTMTEYNHVKKQDYFRYFFTYI